jgi:hypothetical protein
MELRSQVHEIDGHQVALLHVAANPRGCAFFHADGQYDQPGKGSKTVFRAGDVFCRDGTRSVRMNQPGLEQVVQRRVEQERDGWEAEHAVSFRRLADEIRAGATGQQVAGGAAAEFNLALEPDVLVEAAIELMRRDDDIPVRRMLSRAVSEMRAVLANGDEASVALCMPRNTSVQVKGRWSGSGHRPA